MPRLTEKTQRVRREKIAEAAMRCFAQNGFASTSMADIIAESGLSAGSIYSHFEGKADLVRFASASLLESRYQDLLRDLDPNAATITPPILLDRLLRQIETERDQPRLLMQIWTEASRDDELAVVVAGNLTRYRELIADSLRPWAEQSARGVDAEVDAPTDASATARRTAGALIAMVQGYVVRLTLGSGADRAELRAGLVAVLKG